MFTRLELFPFPPRIYFIIICLICALTEVQIVVSLTSCVSHASLSFLSCLIVVSFLFSCFVVVDSPSTLPSARVCTVSRCELRLACWVFSSFLLCHKYPLTLLSISCFCGAFLHPQPASLFPPFSLLLFLFSPFRTTRLSTPRRVLCEVLRIFHRQSPRHFFS